MKTRFSFIAGAKVFSVFAVHQQEAIKIASSLVADSITDQSYWVYGTFQNNFFLVQK